MAVGLPRGSDDSDPDLPGLGTSSSSASEEDILRAIEEEVNSLGMNTTRTNFPDDLEVFFGIYLDDHPKAEDVNRRFRLGSLKVHPDKKAHCGSKVRERCAQLQAAMCSARDALLERIGQELARGEPPLARRPGARRRERSPDVGVYAPAQVESRMDRWLKQGARLWSARSVVLSRVRQEGLALQHASEELRADREIVLVAVRQDGLALAFASVALQADRGVLAAALEQDPLALGHAAPELRADRALVLEAVRRNAFALEHAAEALRADPELVLAALKKSEAALAHAAPSLLQDEDFLLRAVQANVHVLETLPRDRRQDRAFMLKVVSRNGFALKYASADLRADADVIEAALRQDSRAGVHATTGGSCPRGHTLQPSLADGPRLACGACGAHVEKDRAVWRCLPCGFAACAACRSGGSPEPLRPSGPASGAMRRKASEWAARVRAAEDEAARRNAAERASRLRSAQDTLAWKAGSRVGASRHARQ